MIGGDAFVFIAAGFVLGAGVVAVAVLGAFAFTRPAGEHDAD